MPHPVDKLVGLRLRSARHELGFTQAQLGKALGVKFQQVQKYETAMNRISASRLWLAAKFLNKHIYWFFDEAVQEANPQTKEEAAMLRAYRTATPSLKEASRQLLEAVTG